MILVMVSGGRTLVLFVVRGRAIFRDTLFKPLRSYEHHVHNFQTFGGIMGVIFRGFFNNFQNYGLDFHSICEIMALQSTRIYIIKAINFLGQNGKSQSVDRLRYPRSDG